jgi:hypothetical protein
MIHVMAKRRVLRFRVPAFREVINVRSIDAKMR